MAKLAETLSYKSVLQRGYALVRDPKGKPIHAAADIKPWQPLIIEFADGEVTAREDSPKQGKLL